MLPRIIEWWELILGCMRSRTISVPGTTMLTSKDIAYRINIAEVKIAVVDSDNIEKIQAISKECPTLEKVIIVV